MCSPATPARKLCKQAEMSNPRRLTVTSSLSQPRPELNCQLTVSQIASMEMKVGINICSTTGQTSRTSASSLRVRYLSRLGIAPASPQKPVSIRLSRPKLPITKEALKVDGLDALPTQKSRSISFDDSVSVVPIPMRKEYSPRIRKELWCDRLETAANVKRNAIEFAAEGWDWRTVMEEDEMPIGRNGERIHPIHFYPRRCNGVQRQFFMHMSAQRAPAH